MRVAAPVIRAALGCPGDAPDAGHFHDRRQDRACRGGGPAGFSGKDVRPGSIRWNFSPPVCPFCRIRGFSCASGICASRRRSSSVGDVGAKQSLPRRDRGRLCYSEEGFPAELRSIVQSSASMTFRWREGRTGGIRSDTSNGRRDVICLLENPLGLLPPGVDPPSPVVPVIVTARRMRSRSGAAVTAVSAASADGKSQQKNHDERDQQRHRHHENPVLRLFVHAAASFFLAFPVFGRIM